MNIDTLRTESGAYRSAKVGDILSMLRAEHVTHIRTHRGTIAIRPGRMKVEDRDGRWNEERGWTVDRAVDGERSQSKWFPRQEQQRLIRAALLFLNGTLHSFKAGDDVIVEANQAGRDGYVLAVNGDRVLVEYEMPAGTTALVFFRATGDQLYRLNSMPHRGLAQRWVDLIHEQGAAHYWVGKGQRMMYAMALPSPSSEPMETR